MNRFVCALLLIFIISSCSKSDDVVPASVPATENGYTVYLIKKGNHYCENNDNRSIHTKQLRFTALFDSSCMYTTTSEVNMDDINKLYGFSDCNSAHHINSARFGWRWNGRVIEIHAYCYLNGTRQSKFIGNVMLNTPASMNITVSGDQYIFELNGKTEIMQRNCSTEFADGYQLYPYFGGDEAAPHDVRVLIKESFER